MHRFALPIVIAITALLIGIGIGRYTTSSARQVPARSNNPSIANDPAVSNDPTKQRPLLPNQTPSRTKSNPAPASSESAQNIIAKIKAGQIQFNSRRAYATLSKIVESIDASNVREVMAFVQTLPKPEEKSMLMSLVIGRWAELDPAAAVAYAQALPPGI